ncbi:SRP9-21 domain-containing protein [Aphelenchoides besseyi]|nr:SRP9-21 domain-containing protein [Aphelenchoides besseyi]KAI6201559.1 SRP9-21 domain-containing protein [Aphelenchoides besseyi]
MINRISGMDSVKGGEYTNFEDFNEDVQKLLIHSPKAFRFVSLILVFISIFSYIIKPVHKEAKIVIKVTNDIKCLKYVIAHAQDIKKLEQLTIRIMQYTAAETAE